MRNAEIFENQIQFKKIVLEILKNGQTFHTLELETNCDLSKGKQNAKIIHDSNIG